ncbi:anhydro-N-acetylmuramic acid kinase [Pedobacter glucosidilyticus]|uniref:anhydro-N-acetylmuramic acid kinase n=1 Tax=Pedobacter glucosidilyticus TaxID=1122941 RepID=UPI0026F2111D|nr:anhydro-N-acetylmuramic acid kinase [Pedobacter glucosidilyticus]
MNKNLEKLFKIAQKEERIILGLMSGTSLDGLDMALCKFKGTGLSTSVEILHFETCAYESSFKEAIKQVFSKKTVDLELLCLLNAQIARQHAEIINQTLKKWGYTSNDVDAIASHGQTVYHAPKIKHQLNNYPDATLQIGDGDHLAHLTGIITLSDFRQKNIAAGAEGAPLAVYGDYLLFADEEIDRILLNIGGIANFTYLPAKRKAENIFSTDVGPGNTILDQYMMQKFNLYFDEDAKYAKKGICNHDLLEALLADDFFTNPIPKSTGPEHFNLVYLNEAQQKSNTSYLKAEDVLATLCEFTAMGIVKAIRDNISVSGEIEILISGGGMHNPLLVERLIHHLPNLTFINMQEVLGINPDAKEALLFALLANETLCGQPDEYDFPNQEKLPKISMGKLSFPQ